MFSSLTTETSHCSSEPQSSYILIIALEWFEIERSTFLSLPNGAWQILTLDTSLHPCIYSR